MWHKGILNKLGLIVLTMLLLLGAGLGYFTTQKAAADDLPLFEEPALPPAPEEEYVPDQIIVRFKKGILIAAERALNESLGTSVIRTSYRGEFKVLKIPPGKTVAEMVNTYRQHPIVENAQPNYIYYGTWAPNDTYYSLQWHFDQINMEAAWALDTTAPLYGGDSSIVVAVIDSGVAYETYGGFTQAPDLAYTNFWVNSAESAGTPGVDDDGNTYIDDINGWDFVNSDAHPNDDKNHGTHVTGTIAQSTNTTPSLGVAGVAFNTTIMPIKVLEPVWINPNGSWQWVATGTTADVVDGIKYAADNGAHIINMSLGGSSDDTELENAVAYARNAGVIIIASSGNDGDTVPQYPASYDDYVISVGATRYDETRSYYSSYGSHLDIVAPGGDMTVDQNNDGYGDGVLQQTFAAPTIYPNSADPTDFGYWFFQGTSMAAPHVAGVAALILAKNPTWTPAQVRHALQSTATDKGTTGRDDIYGWGLINASSAIGASLPTLDHNILDYVLYMNGTGLLPNHQYRVAYYDGDTTLDHVVTETATSDGSGNLSSQHTFNPDNDVAGDWRVIVCDAAEDPPSTYSSTWTYTLQEDTFYVDQSAIPEFPTALAAIIALALSAGVYLWMRRKAAPVLA